MKLPKLFKKRWEKEVCTFVLQEYGATGEKGWVDITEPSSEMPTKETAMEFFQPGRHYRVMARSTETGQIVGTPWVHAEPLPGGLKAKEVEAKPPKERAPAKAVSPAEVMKEYAEGLTEYMTPLTMLGEVMRSIREAFFTGEGGGGQQQFPPLTFEGGAPWFLHPYIVHETAKAVTDVIDHTFDRMERLSKGEEGEREGRPPPEEEEVYLPRPSEFRKSEVEEKIEEAFEVPVEETKPEVKDERPPTLEEWKRKRRGRKLGKKG